MKRPGEIRFGGMSFALPPPGTFPDTPSIQEQHLFFKAKNDNYLIKDEEDVEFEYYDYDKQTLSDVYPNHPASQIFPNRPVSGKIILNYDFSKIQSLFQKSLEIFLRH